MDPFMQAAIAEAEQGMAEGGIPIGSVLVHDGRIVGRGHNRRVQQGSTVLHAEMDCLENAGRRPASFYRECTLYTTLFPCPMCEMAIKNVRIARVVYGGSPYRWVREVKFGQVPYETIGPVLETECRGLFTAKLRELGRQDILDYETK